MNWKSIHIKQLAFTLLLLNVLACNTKSEDTTVVKTAPESITTVTQLPTEPEQPIVQMEIPVKHELLGSGKVAASNYVDIYFRSQELIANIYVKNGEKVSKGERLADLDITILKSNLRKAEIEVEQAWLALLDILIGQGYFPDNLDAVPADIMKLARVKSGYEQALLNKEDAQRDIDNATITAPFDGVIANLTAKRQHLTNSNTPFCRIIQNSNMDIVFHVLENELHLVKMGQKVEILPQASTIGVQEGKIFEINPIVNEKGLIQIKAKVKGDVGLMEGMNVTVKIIK